MFGSLEARMPGRGTFGAEAHVAVHAARLNRQADRRDLRRE